MRDLGPRMPDFGGNYLQPGCSVIHFYYSEPERLRFVPFLAEGLLLRQAAVVAGPQEFLEKVISLTKPTDGRRRIGTIEQVVVNDRIDGCLVSLTRAIQQVSKMNGVVRVLADFSPVAGDIFQIEAALGDAGFGLKLMKVTQYDGSSVPASIAVEQFRTHSLAIVGDAFYYENHDCVSPEAYFRNRAAVAGR